MNCSIVRSLSISPLLYSILPFVRVVWALTITKTHSDLSSISYGRRIHTVTSLLQSFTTQRPAVSLFSESACRKTYESRSHSSRRPTRKLALPANRSNDGSRTSKVFPALAIATEQTQKPSPVRAGFPSSCLTLVNTLDTGKRKISFKRRFEEEAYRFVFFV